MDFEELYNRRFGEKIKAFNDEMLSQRLEYRKVKDNSYDSIILLIVGIVISLIMYLNSCTYLMCLLFLAFYTGVLIIYYTERTRKCKECRSKMSRFEYNDKVFFCCDKCKTKFKCIISIGNDS